MKYRPDIDGVRAIAVMSVIVAHAGVPFVAGGFLGVDVFFVISGYLITTILKNEMAEGRFSLVRFYERRARRILPALLVVLAACFPFAVWLMLPEFLQNFGQSVVATLFFANNLLLLLTSGYWELESSFKPLLHTWSLGVEEQFYIFFPIFLAVIARYGQRPQLIGIVLIGLASFAFSEYGWRHFPSASFYLPISRAWELMVGCALAYVDLRQRNFDDFASGLSLVALVAPMFLFDHATPSPSLYSAVAVLGTCGVILFSRPGTFAFRLLSLRPVVVIGLMSYSAYLWHQPVFAFARIASFDPPSPPTMAALVVLTLILSYFSWKYIEEPFRDRRKMSTRRMLLIVVPGTALLAAAGLVLHFSNGFLRWTHPNIAPDGPDAAEYNERIRKFTGAAFPKNGKPNVLLIGDSLARDVGNVLFEGGTLAGKNLVYQPGYPVCLDPSGTVADLAPARTASVVVVALHEHDGACARKIAWTIKSVTDAPTVFFGTKFFGLNVNPFGRTPMEKREGALARVPDEVIEMNESVRRALPDSTFVDQLRLLGPNGREVHFYDSDGNPLSPDRMHLTDYGARYLAKRLQDESPAALRTIAGARAPEAHTRSPR